MHIKRKIVTSSDESAVTLNAEFLIKSLKIMVIRAVGNLILSFLQLEFTLFCISSEMKKYERP